ncbi:MAG TPA: ATP-grasp domain-containing protein [Candidatus Paceibacterota bacterium]|nr:ATP-grasp domain-containing protein [Candidatus Paceibacterota bacterium]
MARTIVGVLRGGTSSEYDLSLKTGARALAELPEERYDTRDIFIDKSGIWHLRGLPVPPARALQQVDVVLNALHGGMGEDGTVQRFLDTTGIPYTGTRARGSVSSINKIRSHELLEAAGLRMPAYVAFSLDDQLNTAQMARVVFSNFGPPYVVKPPREGASKGIQFAEGLLDLPDAIGDVLDAYGAALVEQFIRGEHVSTGIIEGFRNEDLYVLPPSQQKIPSNSKMIERAHYHDGLIEHIVPTHFTSEEKKAIEDMARSAHRALGMEHFSRADLVKTPRNVYLLEVNAIPGLYEGASFPPMLESIGSSVSEFLEHAIQLARNRR